MSEKNVRVPAVCESCGRDFMARKDSKGRFCGPSCGNLILAAERATGLCFDKHSGRWKIMCRDGTQMWFYRGVMAAHLGRLLGSHELVHHDDENPANDDFTNLVLTDRPGHMEMHREALRA